MESGIEEGLTQIFRNVFEDDTLVVHRALTAKDVAGWDSLTHVRLLLTAERRFGVRITAAEAGQLKTVGDLMDLLHKKVGAPKATAAEASVGRAGAGR
jgi:acyl carrier protein